MKCSTILGNTIKSQEIVEITGKVGKMQESISKCRKTWKDETYFYFK